MCGVCVHVACVVCEPCACEGVGCVRTHVPAWGVADGVEEALTGGEFGCSRVSTF